MGQPAPTFDETTARRALRKGVVSVLLLIAILTLAIIAVSRTNVGTDYLAHLRAVGQPAYLFAATVVMSFAFVLMGLRWRSLLPGPTRPPVLGLTAILLAGLLLNYALPGPAGELGAGWLAQRRYQVSLSVALAASVTARAIGLSTAALMGGLIWWLFPVEVEPEIAQGVTYAAGAIGLGGTALAALTARPDIWTRLTERVARGTQQIRWIGPLTRRLHHGIQSLAGAATAVLHNGYLPLLKAAGWSFVGHLTVTAGIALAVLGLGAKVLPVGLTFTYTATTAGAVVLFAFPGSQLGWDAAFALLLHRVANLSELDAGAVAALVRFQQLGFMLLGSGAIFWLLRSPKKPNSSQGTESVRKFTEIGPHT